MSLLNSDWLIAECKFALNSATTLGGGLYIEGIKRIQVLDSFFWNNSAPSSAALSLKDSVDVMCVNTSFVANQGSPTQVGLGAVTAQSSLNVSFIECLFEANVAWSGAGLYCLFTTRVHILHSSFRSNVASSRGGGVVLAGNVDVSILYSSFFSNEGSAGGSVVVRESSGVTVSGSHYQSNVATTSSGSAMFVEKSVMALNNNTFIDNLALKGKYRYIADPLFVLLG